jgi:membrane protein
MGARATARGDFRAAGAHPLERAHAFFSEEIWEARGAEGSPGRALLYRACRVAYSTVVGAIENQLTVRAAALAYYSVLSIVPFLAFAFAILKGFGAYTSFIQGTVRPYLTHTFGANPALLGSIERILLFVERTNVSTLGVMGLLALVYTSVGLLRSVEAALNQIWGAESQRSFLRQLTNYVTLLVTTPLLLLAAGTFSTAAQSSRAVLFLREVLSLGPVIDYLLHFTSLVVVALAFFAVYTILPNVRTRPVSVLLGAVAGAALWQGALLLYVHSQMGVSSYNALYSVLSAVPIFLVWTYVSCVVVLVGAQVAASHQNEQLVRQRFRAKRVDQALKETLAVVLAAYIARDFLAGGPRRGPAALANLVEVSPLTVEEILDALVRAGVLARTVGARDVTYVPARDLDAVRLKDLRDALRREQRADDVRADVESHFGPELRQILLDVEEESTASPRNLTLRQLAAVLHRSEDADARPAGAPAGGEPPSAGGLH